MADPSKKAKELAEEMSGNTIPLKDALGVISQDDQPEGDPEILKHAKDESSNFYMDVANSLARNIPHIDSQITILKGNKQDISGVISNKASIIGRLVTFVEKSWELKRKEHPGTPQDEVAATVLKTVSDIMDDMKFEQGQKDKFFLRLSQKKPKKVL